jgi:hypothetical protein
MGARAWGLAILMLGLAGFPAWGAEKTIGRQVQTWRPRPLSPLLPEARPAEPSVPAKAEVGEAKHRNDRPVWDAWITRILNGQPVILFQPAWQGAWPAPQNPWTFSLTPGLRGDPTAGFGAEIVLNGGWSLWGLKLEGDTHLLWAESSGITAWRAAVSRGGLSLELKGWMDDALRPGDLTATAAFRQGF